MRKALMLALFFLNLLAANDANAQNYSSETGLVDLLSKIWEDAMKSNADIYSVVFDDSYDIPDYSKYGNFSQEIHFYSNIDDYMSPNVGDSVANSYKTVLIDKSGTITVIEYGDSISNTILLPELECYSRCLKYCSLCGKWILVEEWDGHHSSATIPSNDNDDTSPTAGGGGANSGNGNSDNTSNYSPELKNILGLTKARGSAIKAIIEKLEKEKRIKEYKVDTTTKNPKNNCYYDYNDHCLHIPIGGGYNVDAITHELIHYLQDITIINGNRMLDYDSCSANNEYQAYVINYILDRTYNKSFAADGNAPEPQGVESTEAWDNFKINLDSELSFQQGGYTYTEKFIDDLNKLNHVSLSETFRSYYEAIDENRLAKGADKRTNENYYKHYKKDYNYNWEELFDKLGFTKK